MYSVLYSVECRTWFRLFLVLFLVWRRLLSLDSPSFFPYLDILSSIFYFLFSIFKILSFISPP